MDNVFLGPVFTTFYLKYIKVCGCPLKIGKVAIMETIPSKFLLWFSYLFSILAIPKSSLLYIYNTIKTYYDNMALKPYP